MALKIISESPTIRESTGPWTQGRFSLPIDSCYRLTNDREALGRVAIAFSLQLQ